MSSGKNKRRKVTLRSTQSFSPVLGIKDGVIVTKDGSYVKLMEISPVNFDLRSPDEQDDIAMAFSGCLRTMPKTVHLKVVNTPSDVTPFIAEMEKLIEKETSPGCRELQIDQINLINGIRQNRSVSRRFFLSFQYESEGSLSRRPDFGTVSELLHRQEREIESSLEACGNAVLSKDDEDYIMSVFYGMMCKRESRSRTFEERRNTVRERYRAKYGNSFPVGRIPVNDYISPGRIDFSVSPGYALIDGKYTMYCFIPSSAYPVRAVAGWTQVFFSLFDGVDVDIWIQREDAAKVQNRLSFELKNNRIRQKNTDDVSRDYDDIESALSAGYYFKNALANGDDFCYISTVITVTGDTVDEMEQTFKAIKDHLIRNDLRIKKCYFQQEEAFLATLPLADCNRGLFEKSKRNITGSQLGSCYPFTAYELNDEGGIFFGVNPRYESPVFINPFNRSVYSNANMLILGPSGSGKTYTLLSMLLRLREKGIQVFCIAPKKGTEFLRACEAVNGTYVKIAPGSAQNINLMEIRKYDSSAVLIDGELAASSSILASKIQQVERFFSILLKDITVQESHILDDALIETYRKFGITVKNKSLNDPVNPERYRKMPVLGDLYAELKNRGAAAERLTESLSRYVTGSAKSFSQPTNVDLDNRFVVLDVSDMTDDMLPVGIFIALDYVLDHARASKTEDKAIAIDELWRLMCASRLTAEFAVEVFKVIRGYGGSAIGATQDLADIMKDEAGTAIINNAKIKFFLPMSKGEAEAIAEVIDITSAEKEQMKTSQAVKPGAERKMLMLAGSNHLFVSVRTSRKEHFLITTNSEDLNLIAAENLRYRTAKNT